MPDSFTFTGALTGASPQRLSEWLRTNGYTGSLALIELEFDNIGAASIFTGGSAVDATIGKPLEAGLSTTRRASGFKNAFIDATQVYLFVAATQNISVSIIAR